MLTEAAGFAAALCLHTTIILLLPHRGVMGLNETFSSHFELLHWGYYISGMCFP